MNARFPRLAVVAILPLLAVACDQSPASQAESLAPLGFDMPLPELGDSLLPSYQTSDELSIAKADELDDRGSYQEIYGITAAPSSPPRAIAEFERTDAVLVAWAGDLSPFFRDMVSSIAPYSAVHIVTPNQGYSFSVEEYLEDWNVDTTNVRFFEYPHEAFWARDFGPIPVELANGDSAIVDARYYYNRQRDDAIPTLLGDMMDVPVYRPDVKTEGGNFMTNGAGLCAVTEWFLQENPNAPNGTLASIQDNYFGCRTTLVMERLDGEGTGHIDMFAKFVSEDTVLVGQYDQWTSPSNAALLDRNADRFAEHVLPNGSSLRVVRIPMPSFDHPTYRTYTNSLIVNGLVIIPTYDTDTHLEDEVVAAYREAMGSNTPISLVDASVVIEYGGAVHCTTMGYTIDPIGASSSASSSSGGSSSSNDGWNDTPSFEPPEDTGVVEEPEPEPTPVATGDGVYASSPGTGIYDGEQTRDRIDVTESGDLGSFQLHVEIDHTYIGDLLIELEHGGYYIEIVRFEGGSSRDINKTWTIGAFEGLEMSGAWDLVIEDHASGDEGTLVNWSLSF